MPERHDRLLWILGVTVVFLVAVVGVLVAVLTLGGSGDAGGPSTTAMAPPPTAGRSRSSTPIGPTTTTSTPDGPVGIQDVTMQEGLIQRQYLVLTPADVPITARLPVVMVLHGLGYDRFQMSRTADWAGAVARARFVAVFPQGVLNSWNAGPCCPLASLANVDDVGFLGRVVAQLVGRSDVNPKRIYLSGFSNGGIMTYTMACAAPQVFAAVASVAGTNLSGCAPEAPVPLLHLHGDPDPVVPYDGRLTLSQLLATADFPPVPDSVAAWASADGCAPNPATRTAPGPVSVRTWSGCAQGARVELVTFPGNGHTWPTEPLDGLGELLRFFDVQRP